MCKHWVECLPSASPAPRPRVFQPGQRSAAGPAAKWERRLSRSIGRTVFSIRHISAGAEITIASHSPPHSPHFYLPTLCPENRSPFPTVDIFRARPFPPRSVLESVLFRAVGTEAFIAHAANWFLFPHSITLRVRPTALLSEVAVHCTVQTLFFNSNVLYLTNCMSDISNGRYWNAAAVGLFFWTRKRIPKATNVIFVAAIVVFILGLLSDLRSTKAFSFHNRSSSNFAYTWWQ